MAREGIVLEGLAETRAKLRAAPPEVQRAARNRLIPIGNRIVKRARSRIRKPYVKRPTGAAAGTIRAYAQPGGITLTAGRTSPPYYRWLEYGGTLGVSWAQMRSGVRTKPVVRKRLRGGRYLYPAIRASREETLEAVTAAFEDTKRSVGL